MRRALLALLLLSACGDDADAPEPVNDASVPPPLDAGQPMLDAFVPEPPSDASESDSGEPLPSYSECRGYVHALHAANVPGRGFSSAVSLNQIQVAYTIPTCGGSASNHVAQGLALASLPTRGAPGEPVPLINVNDCVRTSVPTLLATRGALSVYYASNQGGSPHVWVRDDAGTRALSTGVGMNTTDMAVDGTNLYYARGNAITVQPPDGPPRLVLASDEGFAVERIAASKLSTQSMVGWISSAESALGVYLRLLDPNSTTPSAPKLVGTVGPGSGLALATETMRGAVAWSDEQGALFLRTVEFDGTLGAPVRLTSGNQFVTDVAMTRYGIGYAIAFRATPMVSGASVIRLLMVDELGNAARPRVVTEARGDGQGIAVHVANDGRIVVVWAEPGEGDTLVRVARLDCVR